MHPSINSLLRRRRRAARPVRIRPTAAFIERSRQVLRSIRYYGPTASQRTSRAPAATKFQFPVKLHRKRRHTWLIRTRAAPLRATTVYVWRTVVRGCLEVSRLAHSQRSLLCQRHVLESISFTDRQPLRDLDQASDGLELPIWLSVTIYDDKPLRRHYIAAWRQSTGPAVIESGYSSSSSSCGRLSLVSSEHRLLQLTRTLWEPSGDVVQFIFDSLFVMSYTHIEPTYNDYVSVATNKHIIHWILITCMCSATQWKDVYYKPWGGS